MPLPRLYVSRLLPDPVMAVIREQFHLLNSPQELSPARQSLLEGLCDAEAAICTLSETIDGETLAAAPRLKILANCAVGYNNVDLQAARARGVIVTNTPDVLTDATADLTWALILAIARRIVEGDAMVRSSQWPGWAPTQLLGADVSGQTLGIVGMGRIGQAVAARATGFNMRVLYYSRTLLHVPSPDARWIASPLPALLAESDFVTLHVPFTPETHHLLNQDALRLMKPTAFLINTARGPIVDESALVEALQERRLAGAGLDVYEREPDIHPGLLSLQQVVLLPHLGSATLQTRVRMGMICLENISAVLAGRPAPHQVS
jgi:glyoxylate reductase